MLGGLTLIHKSLDNIVLNLVNSLSIWSAQSDSTMNKMSDFESGVIFEINGNHHHLANYIF